MISSSHLDFNTTFETTDTPKHKATTPIIDHRVRDTALICLAILGGSAALVGLIFGLHGVAAVGGIPILGIALAAVGLPTAVVAGVKLYKINQLNEKQRLSELETMSFSEILNDPTAVYPNLVSNQNEGTPPGTPQEKNRLKRLRAANYLMGEEKMHKKFLEQHPQQLSEVEILQIYGFSVLGWAKSASMFPYIKN